MADELINLIHSPARLRALAYLDTVGRSDFSVLREIVGVTDADLSRQLRLLREAGLVGVDKSARRTTVHLTKKGESEFRSYRRALDSALHPPTPTDH